MVPHEPAPMTAEERRDYRIYAKRSNAETTAILTRAIPKESIEAVMDVAKFGEKYSAFVRQAWKDHASGSIETAPTVPITSRLVMVPAETAAEIVAFESGGGNFDHYLHAKLLRKIGS